MQAVVVIAIVIGLCLLYYYFVQWMWLSIVPDFLLVSVVLLLALIPFVYGRSLLNVFGRSGPRRLALAPVFAALAVAYADVARIAMDAITRSAAAQFAAPLGSLLGGLAGAVPLHDDVAAWAGARAANAGALSLVPSVGLMFFAAVPFLLIARGLRTRAGDGRQPAELQYFFRHAWIDLKEVVVSSARSVGAIGAMGVAKLGEIPRNWRGYLVFFLWPLIIAAAIALLTAGLAMVGAWALFVVLHAASITVACGAAALAALAMFLVERAVMFLRSGYVKCPECYEPIPLPHYVCGGCSTVHDRLVPGRYGVFQRHCNCDKPLPTLYWFGKRRLEARCPHCKATLLDDLFNANLHVPVYGGVSAGKSMLMVAAARELLRGELPDVRAGLLDERQQADYRDVLAPAFEHGQPLVKTRIRDPKAFLMSVARGQGLPAVLYLYDAAGEAAQTRDGLDAHRFLAHLTGAIVVIDPFSLPSMRAALSRAGLALPATTSADSPEAIVENAEEALHRHRNESRTRRFSKPVAVVIAKADLPVVANEIGVRLRPTAVPLDWATAGAEDSALIERWLRQAEPSLFQLLEVRFGRVRFFAASAFGSPDAEGRRFSPQGVLAPLCWLLSHEALLRTPRLARVGRTALEWATMVAVLAALIGVPIWALYAHVLPALVSTVMTPAAPPPRPVRFGASGVCDARSTCDHRDALSRSHAYEARLAAL